MLYDLGQATIYETAIIAGQFFLTAGLLAAWNGLISERRRAAWMMAAGVCWALAAGSRVSLPPALGAMAVITAVVIYRTSAPQSRRSALAAIAGLIAPLLIGAGLFAWYNFARFGGVANFGLAYLLNYETHNPAATVLYAPSTANVLPNLLIYLLAPPNLLSRLPYVQAAGGHTPITRWLHLPPSFMTEPLIGMVWAEPFLVFGVFATVRLGRKFETEAKLRRWIILTAAFGAALSFAPVLFIRLAAMRYLADFLPLATILAALGCWEVQEILQSTPRRVREVRLLAGLAIGGGCVMGLLVGIGCLADRNPELFRVLRPMFPILGW
jgi:hypothetical protein